MSKQSYIATNDLDTNDNPAGGYAHGMGFHIVWQDGPLNVDGQRKPENGAFVETILDVVKKRIEHYQETKFACDYNARAIEHIQAALDALNERTLDREQRGVEGTHTV